MNSRSFVFLGILLAAVLAISLAVEVEQSTDVDKAEEVAEPSYCRYRYCCRRGYYGCQRYCCRGSQAEADEKDLMVKPEEESKDVKPDENKGRGGGGGGGGHGGVRKVGGGNGGGGYDDTGETSEVDMKAGSVRKGKGSGKGGKGGGKGGKGGGKGGKGGGGGGGAIGQEAVQEAEPSP